MVCVYIYCISSTKYIFLFCFGINFKLEYPDAIMKELPNRLLSREEENVRGRSWKGVGLRCLVIFVSKFAQADQSIFFHLNPFLLSTSLSNGCINMHVILKQSNVNGESIIAWAKWPTFDDWLLALRFWWVWALKDYYSVIHVIAFNS